MSGPEYMSGGISRPFSIHRLIIGAFALLGSLFLGLLPLQTSLAASSINRSLNYQGRLLTSGGTNVPDGNYSIAFSLYSVASGGTALWTASGTTAIPQPISVQVTDGLFSVLLGDTSFQGQNAFDLDWNQDSLYLGVTVAADSEMTPRKRLSAVPYAFNSETLQGNYASSSQVSGTSGTGTLFYLNQASSTAASATRTALLIETAGTSNFYDYLLRARPTNGADVFTISRQGNVTTTGNLVAQGIISLGDDENTDTVSFHSRIDTDLLPAADLQYSLGSPSFRWLGLNVGNVTSTNVTTTNLFASGTVSTTQLFVNGTEITPGVPATTATLQLITDNGATTTNLLYTQGGILSSASSTFTSDLTVLGQSSLQLLNFTDATGNAVTTTNLFVSGTASTSQLFVGGYQVCLENGTNCSSSFVTSSTWQYNAASNIAYLTTSTQDVLIGGGNTTSSALFIVDYRGNTGTATNTVLLGAVTTTYVGIGTATATAPLDVVGSIRNLIANNQAFSVVTTTSIGGQPVAAAVQGRYAYVANAGSGDVFQIIDVSDPASPRIVGSVPVDEPIGVVVAGQFAYVPSFGDQALKTINISNPSSPTVVSSVPYSPANTSDGNSILLNGKTLYSRNFSKGVTVFDLSNAAAPTAVTSTTSTAPGSVSNGLAVQGTTLFVGSSAQLMDVYDIQNPLSPVLATSTFASSMDARDIFARGRFVFVAGNSGSLNIFDASNPYAPQLVQSVSGVSFPTAIEDGGRYVFYKKGTVGEVGVIDAASATNATIVTSIPVSDAGGDLVTVGKYLLAFNSDGTLSVIDMAGIETNSLLAASAEIGALRVMTDMYVNNRLNIGTSLDVGSGGIMSLGALGVYSSNTTSTIAFAVSSTAGEFSSRLTVGGVNVCLQNGTNCPSGGSGSDPNWTYDATNDVVRTATSGVDVLIGGNTTSSALFVVDKQSNNGSATNTILLGGSTTTYVGIGTSAPTVALDIVGQVNNLIQPASDMPLLSQVDFGGSGTPETLLNGTILYALNGSNLRAVDFSDPRSPRLLGSVTLSSAAQEMRIIGNRAYAADGDNGVLDIVDISSATSMQVLATYNTSSAKGFELVGNYVYMNTGSGIDVVDVSSSTNPVEVTSVSVGGNQFTNSGVVREHNGFIYAFGNAGYAVFDARQNPANPTYVTSSSEFPAYDAEIQGNLLYLVHVSEGFSVVSLENATAPRLLANLPSDVANQIVVRGRYAYTNNQADGFSVYDVSSSTNPVAVKTISDLFPSSISVSGNKLVVGFLRFFFNPYNIRVYDIPGIETASLVADSAELGALNVFGDIRAAQNVVAGSSLLVGQGGVLSHGSGRFMHALTLNGINVCLQDGTNCPGGGGGGSGPSVWSYDDATNLAFLTTTTQDVLMGGNSTATAGFIWDYDENGTSTLYLGHSTNTNVLVGTSTYQGGLTGDFTLNGNDLLVQGMIGSIEGLFSATGVSVGTGTTVLADGQLYKKNEGDFTFSFTDPASNWRFYTDAERLTVASSGHVGISLSNPEEALDVKGNIQNILHANTGNDPHVVASLQLLADSDPSRIYVAGRYAYVLSSSTMATIDLNNPRTPVQVATTTFTNGADPQSIYVVGKYAYIANHGNSTMSVVDLSNPVNPVEVATTALVQDINSPSPANVAPQTIIVAGKYAYVGSYETAMLLTVDVSDPLAPVQLGTTTFTGGFTMGPYDMAIQGRYLYLGNGYSVNPPMVVMDLVDPANPAQVGYLNDYGFQLAFGVAVQGRYAYIADSSQAVMRVVDVLDPTNPVQIATTTFYGVGDTREIVVAGRYAYVVSPSNNSVLIVDVQDPYNPELITQISLGAGADPRHLAVSGRYAYVVNAGTDTLDVIDIMGAEINGLVAHSAEVGTLEVRNAGALTVQGKRVCLEDGTNCPTVSGGGSSPWSFNIGGGIIYPTSGSSDVVFGGSGPGSAGFVFDTDVGGTSTLRLGATANTNLFVGTTTYSGELSQDGFLTTGHDIFLKGNLGIMGNAYGAGSMNWNVPSTSTQSLAFNTVTTVAQGGDLYILDQAFYPSMKSMVKQGNYLYAIYTGDGSDCSSVGCGLLIYDVSSPQTPRLVYQGLNLNAGTATETDLEVRNGKAYLVEGSHILVYDVTRPEQTTLIQDVLPEGTFVESDLAFYGDYAYLGASNFSNFHVYKVMPDGTLQQQMYRSNLFFGTTDQWNVVGHYLVGYSSYVSKLRFLDLTNPIDPVYAASSTETMSTPRLATNGQYVYSAVNTYLDIYDMSQIDKAAGGISRISRVYTGKNPTSITVSGRYAYISDTTGSTSIVDINDPYNPYPVSDTAFGSVGTSNSIAIDGRYAYLNMYDPTPGSGQGFAVVDLGGIESNVVVGHSSFFGTLHVQDAAYLETSLNVGQDLTIGMGGFTSLGSGIISASSSKAALTVTNDCTNTSTVDILTLLSGTSTRRMSVSCDGTIHATNGTVATPADFAEYFFSSTTQLVAGQAVTFNPSSDGSTSTSQLNLGMVANRPQTLGVISTNPAFVGNGGTEKEQSDSYRVVALMGQVPVLADASSSAIQAGDELMVGNDGYAMKAQGPGMILGRALAPLASGTGTIEMYVHPMWWAGDLFASNGSGDALLVRDLMVVSSTLATASTTLVDSPLFTFTAKAWDSSSSTQVTHSFNLLADAISSTSAQFALTSTSGSALLTVSDLGDMTVHGKLYLANKSTGQGSTSTYVFIDDTAPSSTMISTNADGFQAQASYDYAERYPSSESLEPGDLVTFDANGVANGVKRTTASADVVLGIVSTKPGFLTGAYATGTYPIALAGRVPTKVTASNGAIKVGDPLTASNIPGVAMKATAPGMIVGYALEGYDLPDMGSIQVFVKTGYFAGVVATDGSVQAGSSQTAAQVAVEGLATIAAGSKEVKVSFTSLQALPTVYVTPGASVDGGWWVGQKTDTGFLIILEKEQTHDVEFSWLARPLQAGMKRFKSDNTFETVDPLSGNGIPEAPVSGGETASSTSSTDSP